MKLGKCIVISMGWCLGDNSGKGILVDSSSAGPNWGQILRSYRTGQSDHYHYHSPSMSQPMFVSHTIITFLQAKKTPYYNPQYFTKTDKDPFLFDCLKDETSEYISIHWKT